MAVAKQIRLRLLLAPNLMPKLLPIQLYVLVLPYPLGQMLSQEAAIYGQALNLVLAPHHQIHQCHLLKRHPIT